MLVAHVIKATGVAGAEAHLLGLLPALRRHGIQTELIVLAERRRSPDSFVAAARAAGLSVEVVPIGLDFDPTLPLRLARRMPTKPIRLHATPSTNAVPQPERQPIKTRVQLAPEGWAGWVWGGGGL